MFVGEVELVDNNITLWPKNIKTFRAYTDYNRVAMVEGRTIYDQYFHVGGDPNNYDSYVLINTQSHDFNLMELGAGETLDFKSTWRANHANTTGGGSGVGSYIAAKYGNENVSLPNFYSQRDLLANVPEPHTKAKQGAIKMYVNTVEYYSAAKDAECTFQRTSGFSTGLTKEAQKVLSVRTKTLDRLVNGFEERLDCNNLPTTITGVNTEVPGGLSLHQHSAFQLLSGSGDKEKTLGVFRFNPNGTVTHASGDFPFTFEGAPLKINGTLAGATNMLVVVDYKTTEDNSCR